MAHFVNQIIFFLRTFTLDNFGYDWIGFCTEQWSISIWFLFQATCSLFLHTCVTYLGVQMSLLVNRMIWRCLVCGLAGLQNDVQFLRMNKLNFLFFFFYKWNIEIRCLFYSYRKLQFYIYWCKSSPQKTKFRKPDAIIWYFRLGLVATIKVW